MKIVVIGGTGLIGKKTVNLLQTKGHQVLSASASTGVNIVTGQGLTQALTGAEVVIDVSNAPSFEDTAVMQFFDHAGRNLATATALAGVKHYVMLSVVGTDSLQDSGYFRAKLVQEQHASQAKTPYTIVRATQFFEFMDAIAGGSTVGNTVHLPTALFQPIAAQDVAAAMVDIALAAPVNGIIDLAGPEKVSMAALIADYLAQKGDTRTLVADSQALYFGLQLNDQSLNPKQHARLGAQTFQSWFASQHGTLTTA
ncbi:SDR family oxidoreductase [Methylophilus sp. 5]|uniref:SDR family oxidoreductase n=1 Tax=Methylophilus sp. 5 TaxID=1112274 RepID=UPI00048E603A|nr:SDR family oxidoreductase [Methylophilus sp. 5]